MESAQSRQSKYTPIQEAALQKLWVWNYQRKFPVSAAAPLQALVTAMSDEQVEKFIQLLAMLFDAWDKQAAKQVVYPTGGYVMYVPPEAPEVFKGEFVIKIPSCMRGKAVKVKRVEQSDISPELMQSILENASKTPIDLEVLKQYGEHLLPSKK